MAELRYRVVDVFSDRPLAGNALCVVLDPCPVEHQQAVAREMNLSETTFPTRTGDAAYSLRIYTASAELPFAGHPSLGSAWVLGPNRWTQTTSGATVTVEADADGAVMEQPAPGFTDVDVAELGCAGVVSEAGGMRHLLLPTTDDVSAYVPDVAALSAAAVRLHVTTVAVVAVVDDATLHVRVFAPWNGITEDPGTGSAAGPIGVLCLQRMGTAEDVTVRQGDEVGRPCRIQVHAGDDAVRVGGRVAACAEGVLRLP